MYIYMFVCEQLATGKCGWWGVAEMGRGQLRSTEEEG